MSRLHYSSSSFRSIVVACLVLAPGADAAPKKTKVISSISPVSESNSKVGISTDKASFEELRLIVRFESSVTKANRQEMHSALGGRFKKHFSSINGDLIVFKNQRNRKPSVDEADSLCRQYLKRSGVRSCEPDLKIQFPKAMTCEAGESSAARLVAELPEVFSQASTQACEVVPSRGLTSAQKPEQAGFDGLWKVSPLWAQQVIGADLAQELVTQRMSAGQASRVPTGNIDNISKRPLSAPIMTNALLSKLHDDSGSPMHGDETASLVSDPRFGVSPAVTWSAVVSLGDLDKGSDPFEAWNSNLITSLESVEKTPTRLVTASISYFGTSPQTSVDRFVDGGRVFVQSSGNDYPRPSSKVVTRAGHILVGSVGPNGLPSPFSQEPVKVYAPSDAALLSGESETFGGTSGATPLVSGSIVNALALLPDLTNAEVEDLLAKTAVPSFSQTAGGSGAGLLNSYRMAIVAACMADQRSTASVPGRSSEQDASLADCHDQTERAKLLKLESDRFLRDNSCVGQRDGLKALRASFLLNPTRSVALQIAGIYEKLGYPGDGRWYRTAAASLGSPEQRSRHFDDLLNEPSLNQHRYFNGSSFGVRARGFYALSLASRLPPESPLVKTTLSRIESLAHSTDPSEQNKAIEQAMIVGPKALPAISPLLVGGDDFLNPRSVRRAINRLTTHKNEWELTPWIEETKAHFRGTPFEQYLPQ